MPLQHCGHEGAHACRVCWFSGKAQTQFADIRMVSTHRVVFIMFKKIKNPVACEMRSVIHFFNMKNMKPTEIHQLCDLYGEHAMSISMVWKWVQLFNEDAKMCMMNCGAADCLWWLKIWCVHLKRRLDKKTIHHYITFPAFPQISLWLLHEIVSDKLKFRKSCALDAEDAYRRTQIETEGQYIGLSDTIQWGGRKILEPCSHRERDMGVTRSP